MQQTYRYVQIDPDAVTFNALKESVAQARAQDLRVDCFRIDLEGQPEPAEAVFLPDERRLAITYSNDTVWAQNIPDGPTGIEMWVRDPGEWDAHRAEG